jgi:hypothetical protein
VAGLVVAAAAGGWPGLAAGVLVQAATSNTAAMISSRPGELLPIRMAPIDSSARP